MVIDCLPGSVGIAGGLAGFTPPTEAAVQVPKTRKKEIDSIQLVKIEMGTVLYF